MKEEDKKKTPSFHWLTYFSSFVESISRTNLWLKEIYNGDLSSVFLRVDHMEMKTSATTPLNFIAETATSSGSVHIMLEWAHEKGCDWNGYPGCILWTVGGVAIGPSE
jgi:hypothetical protein